MLHILLEICENDKSFLIQFFSFNLLNVYNTWYITRNTSLNLGIIAFYVKKTNLSTIFKRICLRKHVDASVSLKCVIFIAIHYVSQVPSRSLNLSALHLTFKIYSFNLLEVKFITWKQRLMLLLLFFFNFGGILAFFSVFDGSHVNTIIDLKS